MPTYLGNNTVRKNDGTIVNNVKNGEWYDGQRLLDGRFLAPNEHQPGQQVSQEVRGQSAAAQGVSLQQFDQFLASQMQGGVSLPYTSGAQSAQLSGLQGEVDKYNKQLQDVLAKQQKQQQEKLAIAQGKQTEGLEGLKTTATGIRQDVESFSSQLEPAIMEDFQSRRNAVGRLESLLTEGQEYIRQQKEVTGLAAVRNPRINRAIEDVSAEAGIIEAYIAGLDGSIAQAHNIINNKMSVIINSRQEEVDYYKTVIDLAEKEIIRLDGDAKIIAQAEIKNAETFLNNALEVSTLIKSYMADPAKAPLMEGVRLNMSIEEINQTIGNNAYNKEVRDQTSELTMQGATPVYDPAIVPAGQLLSFTDSRGQIHYFKETKSSTGTVNATNYQTPGQRNASAVNAGVKKTTPQGPQFSAPKGTIWTDPATGIRWLSLGPQGWKREGS